MRPLAKGDLDHQHGYRNGQMDDVGYVGCQRESRYPRCMHDDARKRREEKHDEEDPITRLAEAVNRFRFLPSGDHEIHRSVQERTGGVISPEPLRMVKGMDLVGLKPPQENQHECEHAEVATHQNQMRQPVAFAPFGAAAAPALLREEVDQKRGDLLEVQDGRDLQQLGPAHKVPRHARGIRK